MRWLCTLFIFCFGSHPTLAAENDRLDALRLQIGNLGWIESITLREQALLRFHTTDIDGVPGVSQADYDRANQIALSRGRASAVLATLVHDLNGDGQVSREELRLALSVQARQPISSGPVRVMPTEEQVATILEKLVFKALEPDTNADGLITLQEMYAHADQQQRSPWRGRVAVPLNLDTDGDGTVSLKEYETAVDIVLREVDADGDGKISQEEIRVFKTGLRDIEQVERNREARERHLAALPKRVETCAFPAVSKGAFVAVVNTSMAPTLSSVALGDDSAQIGVAHIDIQEGSQPLYVIARSTRGIIWQFTGATHRVAQVVAMADGAKAVPRAGVIGIAKERIHFAASDVCLPELLDSSNAEGAKNVIQMLLKGTFPDVLISHDKLSRVRLPVGMTSAEYPVGITPRPPDGKHARAVYDEMMRNAPLGLATINPETVVAKLPVRAYGVMPGYAGLLQLMERGVLEVSQYTRRVSLTGDSFKREEVVGGFRVMGATTLPADLDGHLKFVVAPGIPVPLGNSRSNMVVCESGAPTPKAGEKCP